MTLISLFQKELAKEAITTRKMLAIIPNDKYDWKPHPKSMTIRQLATHIAELPTWIGMALNTDGLDFATMDYAPPQVNDTKALLELFEKSLQDGEQQLVIEKEGSLDQPWTLRNGDQVYSTDSKADVIRMTLSQIIHHRAQLGVFLRLLDIPIPGSYGPSADDSSF
ncbi:DinB family protein [Flavihumibacter fluvii]|uniref:DinB family protein n=1 Tax=Flavihumibacter fluvii TaxID=2838157 RepID=UPI001BDE7AA8|nr:DinB family protein [Flavihumibacter fluvii]ULQ50619.1 DinB family protein [Flavihumibacter fluvii]